MPRSGRAARRHPPEISVESLLAVHLFVNRDELHSAHQNNIVADESAVFDGVDLDVKPKRDGPQDISGLRQHKMVSNLRGAGLIVCSKYLTLEPIRPYHGHSDHELQKIEPIGPLRDWSIAQLVCRRVL